MSGFRAKTKYFLYIKQNSIAEIVSTMESFLVAGVGFEPHGLRVMSPTSYQAALPRDIKLVRRSHGWCRRPGSNRYDTLVSRDFKSRASACSATPAKLPVESIRYALLTRSHRFAWLLYPKMKRLSTLFGKK